MPETVTQPEPYEIALELYHDQVPVVLDVESRRSHYDGAQEAVVIVGDQIMLIGQAMEDGNRSTGYGWTVYASTGADGYNDTDELRGYRGSNWEDAGETGYAATPLELRETITEWAFRRVGH